MKTNISVLKCLNIYIYDQFTAESINNNAQFITVTLTLFGHLNHN